MPADEMGRQWQSANASHSKIMQMIQKVTLLAGTGSSTVYFAKSEEKG
jgi:hypothetical protein